MSFEYNVKYEMGKVRNQLEEQRGFTHRFGTFGRRNTREVSIRNTTNSLFKTMYDALGSRLEFLCGQQRILPDVKTKARSSIQPSSSTHSRNAQTEAVKTSDLKAKGLNP